MCVCVCVRERERLTAAQRSHVGILSIHLRNICHTSTQYIHWNLVAHSDTGNQLPPDELSGLELSRQLEMVDIQ